MILSLVLLSGCASWLTNRVEASYTAVEKPELVLPQADEVRMRPVEWYIITPENYQEVFAELEKNNNEVVLFGLTSTGYERLSLNLSDVRAFLQQQQSIIKAYETYYKESAEAIDEANKKLEEASTEEDSWWVW